MRDWFKNALRLVAYELRGFLIRHKNRLITTGVFALAMIIVGVIASASSGDESVNYIIIMRNTGSFSIITTYFKTMLMFLLCYIVLFTGVVFRKIGFLGYIVIGFVGYRFGSLINCCISEDAALGSIYFIIYLLPVYLALIATLTAAFCFVAEVRAESNPSTPACKRMIKAYAAKFAVCFGANCLIGVVFVIIVPTIVKLIVIV